MEKIISQPANELSSARFLLSLLNKLSSAKIHGCFSIQSVSKLLKIGDNVVRVTWGLIQIQAVCTLHFSRELTYNVITVCGWKIKEYTFSFRQNIQLSIQTYVPNDVTHVWGYRRHQLYRVSAIGAETKEYRDHF